MEEINKKRKELKEIFDNMDVSKDGSINVKELADYLKSMGTSTEKIKEIMKEADADKSGSMDFDEFYILMTTNLQTTDEDTPEDFIDIFKLFDRDANGLIRIEEIKKVILEYESNLSDEDFDDLFKHAEIENGIFDYKRFIHSMLDKS